MNTSTTSPHDNHNNPSSSAFPISQEDYDEAVLENEECFDLTPAEAVAETNAQFQKLNNDFLKKSSKILSRTHPHSEVGISERVAIHQLVEFVGELRHSVDDDDDDADGERRTTLELLEVIASSYLFPNDGQVTGGLSKDTMFALFLKEGIMFTLCGGILLKSSSSSKIIAVTLEILVEILKNTNPLVCEYQEQFYAFDPICGILQGSSMDCTNSSSGLSVIRDSFRVVHLSCRGGIERSKNSFMRNKEFARSVARWLKSSFVCLSEKGEESSREMMFQICAAACRCIVTICKYEESNKNRNRSTSGITISSAHDNAQSFFRCGLVSILADILSFTQREGDDYLTDSSMKTLATVSMQAIRVLAINDEIVQAFVAVGTIAKLQKSLRFYRNTPALVAPALGVIRNYCGNDEIKTTLVFDGTLEEILACMDHHLNIALIQEHGCGAIAAMALRKPDNAQNIVAVGGVNNIIKAMRKHENCVLIQRQGSLACRNIVSRSPQLRGTLLDAGADEVLRTLSGRHQGSVDEAYAALRDLGSQVGITKYDASGKEIKLQMFGEVKPSFNPTSKQTKDLNDRFRNNSKPFDECINV